MAIRNQRPLRSVRNIFCVNKLRPGTASAVNEKGCFPNADQHVLPEILKMTMHINIRVIHELGMNGSKHIDVDRWFCFYRWFLDGG